MKKHLPIIFLFVITALFFSPKSFFAQIPNAGFEVWSGTPEKPEGWGVLNVTIPFFGDLISASKTSDAYKGDYALVLENKSALLVTLPGIAVTGSINPITFSGNSGFPCPIKPTKLTGYYKYFPAGPDTGSIVVLFTRWDAQMEKRDTVGGGIGFFIHEIPAWTPLNIPTFFMPGPPPDSCQITIQASALFGGTVGTRIMIDALDFFPPVVGIEDISSYADNSVIVFPNPVTDQLNLYTNEAKTLKIKISDITGRSIYEAITDGKITRINTQKMAEGIYLYHLTDDNNVQVAAGKFVVSK